MKRYKTSSACLIGFFAAALFAVSLNNIPLSPAEAALAPEVPEGAIPPGVTLPETTIPENAPLDFRVLDANHDGVLSQEEFDAGHRNGPQIFTAADTDKDNTISREEFDEWVGSIEKPKQENGHSGEIAPQSAEDSNESTPPKDKKDNCYPKSEDHPDGNGTCFFP